MGVTDLDAGALVSVIERVSVWPHHPGLNRNRLGRETISPQVHEQLLAEATGAAPVTAAGGADDGQA